MVCFASCGSASWVGYGCLSLGPSPMASRWHWERSHKRCPGISGLAATHWAPPAQNSASVSPPSNSSSVSSCRSSSISSSPSSSCGHRKWGLSQGTGSRSRRSRALVSAPHHPGRPRRLRQWHRHLAPLDWIAPRGQPRVGLRSGCAWHPTAHTHQGNKKMKSGFSLGRWRQKTFKAAECRRTCCSYAASMAER